MGNQGKLGIGNLHSLQKTSGDSDQHDAGDEETEEEHSSEERSSEEKSAAEMPDDSSSEDTPEGMVNGNSAVPDPSEEKPAERGPSDSEEPQASQESQEDEPIGQGSGAMVYDQSTQSSGHQKVEIKCHATSCVFNRQHNCHAQEVEIDMSSEKGQVPSATSCNTYQPATPNGDSNEE